MPNTLYLGTYSQQKRINETEGFPYKIIENPAQSLISIAEMQRHLRIDIPLEQTSYLNLLIKNVIRYAGQYLNLSLLNTKWRTYRNNFDCDAFTLRKGYFVSLDEFKYIDIDSNLYVNVDPDVYYIADKLYYALIMRKKGQEFPVNIADQDNAITIEFTAGMAETPQEFEDLYADLKMALLQHCCFNYENRGNDVAVNSMNEFNSLPAMIREVYDRYRDVGIFGGDIFNI